MWYVGMDIHSKSTAICILGEQGKVIRRQVIRGPWPVVAEEMGKLGSTFAVRLGLSL